MRRPACLIVLAATCACGGSSNRTPRDKAHDRAVERIDGGGMRSASNELSTLRRLWGSAPDDVWAVGAVGLVLHFDGNTWRKVPCGTEADLVGIAGRRGGDAWIVGKRGTLLRLSGAKCAAEDLRGDGGAGALPQGSDFSDVWVADDGTAWVAGGITGDNPIAVLGRYERGRWIFDHDDGQPLTALWGRAADDVWARGSDAVVHWNGRYLIAHPREKLPNRRGRHGFAGGWRLGKDLLLTHPTRPSPPPDGGQKKASRVQDFWAFGSDDVWAATRSGLLHFDGRTWEIQVLGDAGEHTPVGAADHTK